jgi:hypothetical protein
MATTTQGKQGHVAEALPLDKVQLLLKEHGVIKK